MKKYVRRIWDGDEERQGGEVELTVMILNEDELSVVDAALDMYHETLENMYSFGDTTEKEEAISTAGIIYDIRKDLGLPKIKDELI